MQNINVFQEAPHQQFSKIPAIGFIKVFKYEIIKILIFLLLFFASLFYVNSESKVYYGGKPPVSGKL